MYTEAKTRITARIHVYVRTFTRVEGEVPVLDDVAPTSTSFYDLRAMRLKSYALRLRYTYIRRLYPRNFIQACRLRSRNFHVKVSNREEERGKEIDVDRGGKMKNKEEGQACRRRERREKRREMRKTKS